MILMINYCDGRYRKSKRQTGKKCIDLSLYSNVNSKQKIEILCNLDLA